MHPNTSNFGMARTFEKDQTEAENKQCLYGPQSMQLMETSLRSLEQVISESLQVYNSTFITVSFTSTNQITIW